jgi:predicted TIM-barrel fold metal-dependent hydrolase
MNICDEPNIDCHNHVLDPLRFPFAADATYRPSGQELGSATQLTEVLNAYGLRYALVVGPNSGYGTDNRCLLDAIAQGAGRVKGVAVVRNDAEAAELERLKAAGIVGVTMNATDHGAAYYANTGPLLAKLAALGLFVQVLRQAVRLREIFAPTLSLPRHTTLRRRTHRCVHSTPASGARTGHSSEPRSDSTTGHC